MLTLELADAVLKDDYQGPIRKQINDGVKFLAQVEKRTQDFVGRRAIIPCHVGRNTGRGFRQEGEAMAAAGSQRTIDAILSMRYFEARIRLTKQVISHMASDAGSFVRAVKLETKGVVADSKLDWGRAVWGTSDGVVATCGTTTASATVQLATATPESILIGLREGMRVDIGTVANPTLIAADRLVTAVDLTNKTMTISGGVITTSATHRVFQQGNGGATGGFGQREITGVNTLVDDTATLQGIAPASEPSWASIVDTSVATRPFSENLVERVANRALNLSGMETDIMYAEDATFRHCATVLKGYQRQVNTAQLKGGHSGITFGFGDSNDAVLTKDRHATPGAIHGFATDSIAEWVLDEWQWEQEDGHVLRLSADSTHTFEGIFFRHAEVGAFQRNCNWRIENLEEA